MHAMQLQVIYLETTATTTTVTNQQKYKASWDFTYKMDSKKAYDKRKFHGTWGISLLDLQVCSDILETKIARY